MKKIIKLKFCEEYKDGQKFADLLMETKMKPFSLVSALKNGSTKLRESSAFVDLLRSKGLADNEIFE